MNKRESLCKALASLGCNARLKSRLGSQMQGTIDSLNNTESETNCGLQVKWEGWVQHAAWQHLKIFTYQVRWPMGFAMDCGWHILDGHTVNPHTHWWAGWYRELSSSPYGIIKLIELNFSHALHVQLGTSVGDYIRLPSQDFGLALYPKLAKALHNLFLLFTNHHHPPTYTIYNSWLVIMA